MADFEDPALLLRRCRPPWTPIGRSLSRAREDLASFRPPPVLTRAEKTRIAAMPALFGLSCRRQRQRGYHLSDKRNRGSVSTFDRVVAGPPCRKGLLVEPEVFEARAAHSRAFLQLMSLNVESADLESPDLARLRTASRHSKLPSSATGEHAYLQLEGTRLTAEEGGKTQYTARVRHWTVVDRETHEGMGFHEDWRRSADQLAALVAKL